MEIQGGVKKNYSYPPNILEGNEVVFENLTFINLQL